MFGCRACCAADAVTEVTLNSASDSVTRTGEEDPPELPDQGVEITGYPVLKSGGGVAFLQQKLDDVLAKEEEMIDDVLAETVADIIKMYPQQAIAIVAYAQREEEPAGVTVHFMSPEPQEPSGPLLRARSLREILKTMGCTNPISAKGVYEDGGGRCEISVCNAWEVPLVEADVTESLKEVRKIFTSRPVGLRLAHYRPIAVCEVVRGEHADDLKVMEGWLLKSIAGTSCENMAWEDGVSLMQRLVETL